MNMTISSESSRNRILTAMRQSSSRGRTIRNGVDRQTSATTCVRASSLRKQYIATFPPWLCVTICMLECGYCARSLAKRSLRCSAASRRAAVEFRPDHGNASKTTGWGLSALVMALHRELLSLHHGASGASRSGGIPRAHVPCTKTTTCGSALLMPDSIDVENRIEREIGRKTELQRTFEPDNRLAIAVHNLPPS